MAYLYQIKFEITVVYAIQRLKVLRKTDGRRNDIKDFSSHRPVRPEGHPASAKVGSANRAVAFNFFGWHLTENSYLESGNIS